MLTMTACLESLVAVIVSAQIGRMGIAQQLALPTKTAPGGAYVRDACVLQHARGTKIVKMAMSVPHMPLPSHWFVGLLQPRKINPVQHVQMTRIV